MSETKVVFISNGKAYDYKGEPIETPAKGNQVQPDDNAGNPDVSQYATGGGFYTFPVEGGEPVKVRGREAAIEYYNANIAE